VRRDERHHTKQRELLRSELVDAHLLAGHRREEDAGEEVERVGGDVSEEEAQAKLWEEVEGSGEGGEEEHHVCRIALLPAWKSAYEPERCPEGCAGLLELGSLLLEDR
jgi:hypothetical protein